MKKKVLNKTDKLFIREHFVNKAYDLASNLLLHDVRGEVFDYIMQGTENVNFTSNKQRQQWLAGAIKRVDEKLPADFVKQLREDSACCLGGEREKLAKEIHDTHSTVDERFEALATTRYIIGDTAKKVGDGVYRICFWEHPQGDKGCSCVKYVPKDEPMSKSWCMCCGGHIKHHFETALGVKATCTCVSSQLSSCGKEPCVFELHVDEVL